jgi:hypothetical protein
MESFSFAVSSDQGKRTLHPKYRFKKKATHLRLEGDPANIRGFLDAAVLGWNGWVFEKIELQGAPAIPPGCGLDPAAVELNRINRRKIRYLLRRSARHL